MERGQSSGFEAVRAAMETPADAPLPSVRQPSAEVRRFAPPALRRSPVEIAAAQAAATPAPRPDPDTISEEAKSLLAHEILEGAQMVHDAMIAAAVARTREAQKDEEDTRKRAAFILKEARGDAAFIAERRARDRGIHSGFNDVLDRHGITLAVPCGADTDA